MTTLASFRTDNTHVRTAALLIACYGVVVVLSATALQISGGWDAGMTYPRAVLRLFGAGLMAWGLMQRNVWAWRIAVVATAFWGLTGALSLMLLAEMAPTERLPLPLWWFGFVAAMVVLLFGALAALLAPSTRDEFRQG